jgi:CheY-like chemotaxis protein
MTFHDPYPNRAPGILIVDPNSRTRAELVAGMGRQGWQVWSAAGGMDAIEMYRLYQEWIDIVLVDLQLPGLQGGQVLAELADLNPDLIRCAMSADVNPYAASAFRRMSDTPLFTKPMDVRALSFTLHEMVVPVSKR